VRIAAWQKSCLDTKTLEFGSLALVAHEFRRCFEAELSRMRIEKGDLSCRSNQRSNHHQRIDNRGRCDLRHLHVDIAAFRHIGKDAIKGIFRSARADVQLAHRAHHHGGQQKAVFNLQSSRIHQFRSQYKPQFSIVVRLLLTRARLDVVRRAGLGADPVPCRIHKNEEGWGVCVAHSLFSEHTPIGALLLIALLSNAR